MNLIGHFIGGKHVAGTSGRSSPVFNPAKGGEPSAAVALASSGEVDCAVDIAEAAQADWGARPPLLRARVMFKLKELLERNLEDIARRITLEHGKTLEDAKGEVVRGIEVVEFACGIPHLLRGDMTPEVGRGIDTWSARHPLGVVAGITPFNFPVMIGLWMAPMAIACGNAFLWKPSEKDPSASLRIAELMMEAGVPAGVINVVNGDKQAVDAILTHPKIAAIGFVGSTAVGEYVYTTGCAHGKRVQALCGAKNHMVVMPDADLDESVDALMGAGYGAAGERCMAISVAVAVGKIADPLVEKLSARVRTLKIGPGVDPQIDMGPLVTKEHLAKVRSYIDLGVAEGATLVVDGRELRVPGHEHGYYIGGCLFDDVKPEMRIYKEEIFGPVLSITRVGDYDSAIKLVNEHEYGNGAVIFTRDGGTARSFSANAKAGMIGINVPIPVPLPFHSFGGWKRSILGDRNSYGPEAVGFYTKIKTTTARWSTRSRAGAEFVMPTMR